MDFVDRPSPNFNERKDGQKPSLIILHFTGGKSPEYALDILTDGNREKKVSAHYMIHEDGTVYRLVDESKRAWHAGVSFWRGIEDVNSASIGIEISNRDRKPYTKEQLVSLAALCHSIQRRHGIPPENVIGHSDIAPGRKDDPGYHFPWRDMARQDIGRWPKPSLRDKFSASASAQRPEVLKALFAQAGYRTDDLPKTINAFQQHYEPHVFTSPGKGEAPGKATGKTVAKLRALARRHFNSQHRA